MFGIAGTVELGTICPGTGTWNRLQDGSICYSTWFAMAVYRLYLPFSAWGGLCIRIVFSLRGAMFMFAGAVII